MHKQPEVTAATRARLMDAFWALYRERPMEKITVSSIVKLAGVHRSTFYEYFQDVYDVLEQIEKSLIDEMERIVSQIAEDLPAGDPILLVGAQLSERFAPHAEKMYYLSSDPDFQPRIIATLKPYLLRVSHLPERFPNQDFLFTLFASNILTTLHYWYAHRQETTIQELVGMVQQVLYFGLVQWLPTMADDP